MEQKEHSNPDPAGSSSSLPAAPQGTFQPGARLRDKLEELAEWRIHPSLIEFPGDGPEFSGGYATVSRALLAFPSDIGRQDSQLMEGESNALKEDEREPGKQPPGAKPSERKMVAVKKMKIEKDADRERVLGLALRESELLVDLSHPNIIKLQGFVEDVSKNVIWLVFLWEENGSLRDFLASNEGQLQIPERISLIHDVTIGLEYLHTQRPPICHGDLKSLNILVNSEYQAMITDFGSARRLENESDDKQTRKAENKAQPAAGPDSTTGQENTQLQAVFSATTNTITLTGYNYTIRWAAPELLKDELPSLASDIWALGWVAYEVMTNTLPFHDVKNENVVVNRVVRGDLPLVTSDARMSLIQALCWLMAQCWSIDPEKRPKAEDCRKSISWMPKFAPAPGQTVDTELSRARNALLLRQLGRMYERQSDYRNAFDCFTRALDIRSSALDVHHRPTTLCFLADLHLGQGNYSAAASFASEALQIWTDANDQNGRAVALFRLAQGRRLQRKYDESIKAYSEALDIRTRRGERRGRALALWGLASAYIRQGKYSEATPLYSEALEIYTDIGDQRGVATTLCGLAETHRFQREFTQAVKLYSQALQIYINIGNQREIAACLWNLARINQTLGEHGKAIERYSEALRIRTEIGDKRGRANALRSLAETHRALNDHDDAISLFTEASQALREVGAPEEAARALKDADDIRKSLEVSRRMETLEV